MLWMEETCKYRRVMRVVIGKYEVWSKYERNLSVLVQREDDQVGKGGNTNKTMVAQEIRSTPSLVLERVFWQQ